MRKSLQTKTLPNIEIKYKVLSEFTTKNGEKTIFYLII